eukprot:s5254_g8.t1
MFARSRVLGKASSPTLKAMWQHEVKAALDGMTTDDVSKLDPNQLKQLMEAEKEVDARIDEVNKMVEDHGEAVEHLKNLFAGNAMESGLGVGSVFLGAWVPGESARRAARRCGQRFL